MNLPFPTGEDVQRIETDNSDEIINILKDFRHILNYRRTKDGQIKVSLKNIDNVLDIKALSNLLKIKNISSLSKPAGIIDFRTKISQPIIILLELTIQQNILPFEIIHPSDVDDIVNGIAEIINKHNHYLENTDKHLVDHIVKNYTVNALYKVIEDPANLVQAQTSVDATTDAFKQIANTSAVNEDIKTRTAGNSVNKVEGINDNQVGKDCISICAVGIKGYFALTQYSNYILNNGTSEEQLRLVGKVGNFKTILSNIRAKDLSTVTNQEVLDALVSAKGMDDQVLILSSLLSLSTDNAKELALAKLNAGINMIGAYIYGITIGKDFREISKLLMSETGEILRDVIDENNMQDTPGYGKLQQVFDYFLKGPFKHLNKFNQFYDYNNTLKSDPHNQLTWLKTPLERLLLLLYPEGYRDSKSFLLKWINTKLYKERKSITDIIAELDSYRNNYVGSNIDRVRFNQLIDFAQEYAILKNTVKMSTLDEIQFLADGAHEMEILGKIVGLNQGIPTDIEGLITKCNFIENALEKLLDNEELKKLKNDLQNKIISLDDYQVQLQNLTGYYRIDLLKFAFDKNYRLQCINDYEKVKHSFNILDVVDKLPHVLKYVQALAVVNECSKRSYRYRSIKDNYNITSTLYGVTNSDAIKGLNLYLGSQIVQDWMLSEDINVYIPEGNKIFDKNGVLSEKDLSFGIPLKLGSEYANASFRRWVETEVIPNLKKQHPDNRFIQDLGNDTRNNTLSGNGSVVYTLPINMLPRTDADRATLNIYIDSFNELANGYDYEYKVTTLDNTSNHKLSILDIFTLYSMIAHDWRLGESSLVPILEGFLEKGLIKNLHDYTAKLDYSDRILELNYIEQDNLIPYMSSKKGIYASFSKYAWGYNEKTEKNELFSKNSSGKYVSNITQADLNYFQGTIVRSEKKLINQNVKLNINGKNTTVKLSIEWSQGNKQDIVKINNNEVLKEYCKNNNLPVKSQYVNAYRMTQPDINKIKELILRELDENNKLETCNTPI